jgi:peptidoglycan/xylan/chitin deacetylase (PgdA/CDA1 family)
LPSRAIKDHVFRISGRLLRRAWPLSLLARRFFHGRAAVVFYHGVWRDDDVARRTLFGGMRLSDFAADMRRLAGFFDVVPLSEILANSPRSRASRPRVAVTFDDGLDLRGGGALDVMDSLGIRATTFVNTASLAGGHLMWMHRFSAIRARQGDAILLRELNRIQRDHALGRELATLRDLIPATRDWPQEQKDEWAADVWERAGMEPLPQFLEQHRPYADVEQLKDWLRRGHAVGFHTATHPFCSRLTDSLLETEVINPVAGLRSALDIACLPLAYPFGDRCRPEHEARLREMDLFSGLIGTAGFSPAGAEPDALERVEAEAGIDREVFGKPILRLFKR